MSNTGFTFPPPPPPPPKKDVMPGAEFGGYGSGNKGGSFNRGNDRGGGFRSRGRGFGGGLRGNSVSGSRGGGRGSSYTGVPPPSNGFIGHREWSQGHLDRGTSTNSTLNPIHGTQQGHSQPGPRPTSSSGTNHWNPPQKRDHATAFNHRGRGGSKPPAAPAVPSFLSNIPGLSPPTPSATSTDSPKSSGEKKLKLRTSNILGLNPSVLGPESDDDNDNEDEEAKLATTTAKAGQIGVAFEYRGQIATLKTPGEIAAWIADRKKRFPTAAKAELAKKEAQEKQRKWEEEKKANQEARRLQRETYEQEKAARVQEVTRTQKGVGWPNAADAVKAPSEGSDKTSEAAEKARIKTEKLIKKAAKAQKQLEKAQDALRKAQGAAIPKGKHEQEPIDPPNNAGAPDTARTSKPIPGLDDSDASSILTDVNSDNDDDDTSSSGSSSEDSTEESDSDAAPETTTTKRTAVERIPPPPRATPPASSEPCRNMVKFGGCKAGKKCRFSHDPKVAVQVARQHGQVEVSQMTGRPKRKGLWEVMVEKEKEEEARTVLRVIMEMGERGLLQDDT